MACDRRGKYPLACRECWPDKPDFWCDSCYERFGPKLRPPLPFADLLEEMGRILQVSGAMKMFGDQSKGTAVSEIFCTNCWIEVPTEVNDPVAVVCNGRGEHVVSGSQMDREERHRLLVVMEHRDDRHTPTYCEECDSEVQKRYCSYCDGTGIAEGR